MIWCHTWSSSPKDPHVWVWNSWRTQTVFVALDRLDSTLLWLPFSHGSGWPLCWWPYSKLILSSPMWLRGSTSGIHSITNGPASFGSAEPVPARVHRSVSRARGERICAAESGANKLTHRLWGRCGAPEALWVVGVLSCVPRAEAEVRDSGSGSRCRRCSSQNSGRAPEAPETHHVCDRGLWLAGLRSHVRLPPGCRRCAWPAWGRWCARCTWWKSPLEGRQFSQTLVSAKRDRENLVSAPESSSLTVTSNRCIYLLWSWAASSS